MEQKIKQRSSYWDNIKGILMLLTVFAHIIFSLQMSFRIVNYIVDFIYMFHMPAFVFVSGYFGKGKSSHSPEAIGKLIFLFFTFNSIMGFIYGFGSITEPLYSYWYLIALIAWRLTAHYIARFRHINLILILASLVIGFFPGIDNTFAIARIIGFYPFYMAGYLLNREKSDQFIRQKYRKRLAIGSALAILTGALSFDAYNIFNYSDGALQMEKMSGPIDALGRIVLYIIAFLAIYTLRLLSPDKKLPLITMFGRNSLWIFVLHRPFTLILCDNIMNFPVEYIIAIAAVCAIIMCAVFGNDFTAKYLNMFLQDGIEMFTVKKDKKFNLAKITTIIITFCFLLSGVSYSLTGLGLNDLLNPKEDNTAATSDNLPENTPGEDIIYPVMTSSQKQTFDNAFRITFAGDLILLEDQVKRAYDGTKYDFSEVFEYAKPYISSADLAIGVFEGPMAGEQAGYSSGNFDDSKKLYLNFPDEFAEAVMDAGFDLVTTANNHLLDRNIDGAMRTLDVLDKLGLEHTGSYRNADEKKNNHVKVIECQGIRFAILSYTYGSNNTDINDLIDGNHSFLTSVISGTKGEMFEKLKASVENDFKQAKAASPDFIIVLPHIGTQFSNEPDDEQTVWFNIFKENGADIILGDHPHVVEPVLIEKYNGKNVYTAYCPGNFANIYRDDQGDTSMLTDVYIDRSTKKIIGGSIVPLYTHARADHNYRAVPIYDIMTDKALREQLTTDDIERSENAHDIITRVVFGNEMDITSITERYYFNENGFLRMPSEGLELTEKMKDGILYKALNKADKICFIGDSVTEGTKNGGCPWYEPIIEYFPGKSITNYSKGGCTVSYMTKRSEEIPDADLYVIALGTNDIRYRDSTICAMTAESYVSGLDALTGKLRSKHPDAEFVFIAPWFSTDGDPFCPMTYEKTMSMNSEYSSALQNYCQMNHHGFINANEYIRSILKTTPDRTYLLDHIHPNSTKGVIMYSEAALSYS